MLFFLQGPSRIGKSHMIREVLRRQAGQVAGYMVQRLWEEESVVGYRALRLEGDYPPLDHPYRPEPPHPFILRGVRDPALLERVIAEVEADAALPERKLILLDEIGGVELLTPGFMEPLTRLLTGPKPCVGVLKSADNFARSTRQMSLGPEFSTAREALEELIQTRGSLHSVTADTLEEVRPLLADFVRSALGEEPRPVSHELLMLFAKTPDALPLYFAAADRILAAFEGVRVKVSKTQVSFSGRYGFAYLWPPVSRRKGWPKVCLILTFGLGHRVEHPRIVEAVEPYPGRWTHHVILERPEDVDELVMGWVRASYAFSQSK